MESVLNILMISRVFKFAPLFSSNYVKMTIQVESEAWEGEERIDEIRRTT